MPTKQEVAESFGADAQRYDRTRPSYPQELIERIATDASVLDVGCGTGIAARQFQAAGCTVLGVDVDPRMAELAPVEVEIARFEDWDPRGRRFDVVASAQTWHWIDPVAGAKKAAEVSDTLAVFWNVMKPAPEIARAFAAVYERVAPDLPFKPWATLDAYDGIIDRAAQGMQPHFAEPERLRIPWEREYTRDEWLEQVPTHGGHNRLPPDVQAQLLEGIGAAVDALGGRFTMTYYAAALIASASRST
jgi:SAM-dependent methyltransferase